MRCTIALLCTISQVLFTNGAVNYCGAKMCGHSNAHTFCQYRAGPSPSCTGYIEAHLSKDEKAQILARLNRRRSEVARGTRNWPQAGDMLKLLWVEELYREAQRWADQCRLPQSPEERDLCRDLYSISVGQSVASIVGEAPGLRPESMVDMWYMQSMAYDRNVTSYIPPHSKHWYGDFAQMIWYKTYMVGCGRSRFMADWHGRLRSVERLVCNFAPRGPIRTRPLWTPAEPASICPPRSRPDIDVPGLCVYQNVDKPKTINHNTLVQFDYILDAVLEIEKNESLNYLGSLDEIYLTKIAIATIEMNAATIPLYYSYQKRDAIEKKADFGKLWITNETGLDIQKTSINLPKTEETTAMSTEYFRSNIIGRPKSYDINDLSNAAEEEKVENVIEIRDAMRTEESDLYDKYVLEESDEENIGNNSATLEEIIQTVLNDTLTLEDKSVTLPKSGEINTVATGMEVSENYFNKTKEESNGIFANDKNLEDYLTDPETVQQLQEALDRMERTLASQRPLSTSGKVRRELRNLDADLENATKRQLSSKPVDIKTSEVLREEDRNKSRDRATMLRMVLNYLPYLKPYEESITGETASSSGALYFDLFVLVCSLSLTVNSV